MGDNVAYRLLRSIFVHVFPMYFHECLRRVPTARPLMQGRGREYFTVFFIFNSLRGVPLGGGVAPESVSMPVLCIVFMVADVKLLK